MLPKSAEHGKSARSVSELYIFVIVKVPVPEQPGLPAIVHVPEIVFPVSVPVRVRVLPAGVPEFTTKPNVPLVLPFKFPLTVNVPVAVWPETKHDELTVESKVRDGQ